jgi:hypothetical protein
VDWKLWSGNHSLNRNHKHDNGYHGWEHGVDRFNRNDWLGNNWLDRYVREYLNFWHDFNIRNNRRRNHRNRNLRWRQLGKYCWGWNWR